MKVKKGIYKVKNHLSSMMVLCIYTQLHL